LPSKGFQLLSAYADFNFVTALPTPSQAAAASKARPPAAPGSSSSSSAAAALAKPAAAEATAAQVRAHLASLSSIKGVASVRKEVYFKLLSGSSGGKSQPARQLAQEVCDTGEPGLRAAQPSLAGVGLRTPPYPMQHAGSRVHTSSCPATPQPRARPSAAPSACRPLGQAEAGDKRAGALGHCSCASYQRWGCRGLKGCCQQRRLLYR
jgi:hypothetical protein